MRISDPQLVAALPDLGVELRSGVSLAELTSAVRPFEEEDAANIDPA